LVVTAERTPLYDEHVRLGAQMTNFGGWVMPLQYGSIREEHRAVREAVGLFDLSHMGELRVSDESLAQRVVTRDLTRLKSGRIQYAMLCNETGGIVDDVGEFFAGFAAERHDDIAAALADGVDLVGVKILVHGDATVPGGFFVVGGGFAVEETSAAKAQRSRLQFMSRFETATHKASGRDAVGSRPTGIGDFRVKGLHRLAVSAFFRRGER